MNISKFLRLPYESKLIIINGGLGNQIFQYALGAYFENKFNKKVFYLDISQTYKLDYILGNKNLHDSKLKKLFNLELKMLKTNQILKWPSSLLLNGYLMRLFNLIYYKFNLRISRNIIFDKDLQIENIEKYVEDNSSIIFFGYWHHLTDRILNETFRKNIIFLESLTIPEEIKSIVLGAQNIAVHVRRGDNAVRKKSIEAFGTLPINYYLSAINLLRSKYGNLKVIFFTDDREWTQECLLPKVRNSIIFDKKFSNSTKDFFLMSKCSHFVISNSTYSWWGSYIARIYNPNCHIVFPSHFYRLTKIQKYYIPYRDNFSIVNRY